MLDVLTSTQLQTSSTFGTFFLSDTGTILGEEHPNLAYALLKASVKHTHTPREKMCKAFQIIHGHLSPHTALQRLKWSTQAVMDIMQLAESMNDFHYNRKTTAHYTRISSPLKINPCYPHGKHTSNLQTNFMYTSQII